MALDMADTRSLDRAVAALAILGLLTIGGGLFFAQSFALHLGFTLWWVAFTTVVIENYVAGRPVRTRGGVVRKDDDPIRYALPYIGLGAVIVLSAVVLLSAWLAR